MYPLTANFLHAYTTSPIYQANFVKTKYIKKIKNKIHSNKQAKSKLTTNIDFFPTAFKEGSIQSE